MDSMDWELEACDHFLMYNVKIANSSSRCLSKYVSTLFFLSIWIMIFVYFTLFKLFQVCACSHSPAGHHVAMHLKESAASQWQPGSLEASSIWRTFNQDQDSDYSNSSDSDTELSWTDFFRKIEDQPEMEISDMQSPGPLYRVDQRPTVPTSDQMPSTRSIRNISGDDPRSSTPRKSTL